MEKTAKGNSRAIFELDIVVTVERLGSWKLNEAQEVTRSRSFSGLSSHRYRSFQVRQFEPGALKFTASSCSRRHNCRSSTTILN